MTNENTPAVLNDDGLDGALQMAEENSFLRRLSLAGPNSGVVIESKVGMGSFYIADKETPVDLGKSIDALVVKVVACAMKFGDEGSAPTVSYDHTSDTFQEIRREAESTDKEKYPTNLDNPHSWGYVVLLYLPEQDEFVTYFLSGKTTRPRAKDFQAFKGMACTTSSKLNKGRGGKIQWFTPVIADCGTPFDLPSIDEQASAAEKLMSTPEAEPDGETSERE